MGIRSVYCYPTPGKKRSGEVCAAFAAGCGGVVVEKTSGVRNGDAMFYGITKYSMALHRAARASGSAVFYADNGYFGRGAYFRVTRNRWQHDGTGVGDEKRLAALGVRIHPWRRGGRHVLVCPPGELYASRMEFSAERWLRDTLALLKTSTDRELRVRVKPDPRAICANKGLLPNIPPTRMLEEDLEDCHALVTMNSNVAVEALTHGVPVFTTTDCAAARMGLSDLTRIEKPSYPDGREAWAAALAANQWTREEMKNGTCWRMLNADT